VSATDHPTLFDEAVPDEAHSRDERLARIAVEALAVMRAHLRYESWQDAWSACLGGYGRDGDPRILQGSANLLLIDAMCGEEDPLDADSVFCFLAEIGALAFIEDLLGGAASGRAT